jgi:hypothetical protein
VLGVKGAEKYLHETVGVVSPWQQSYFFQPLLKKLSPECQEYVIFNFLKIIVKIIIAMTTEILATAINDRGHYSKLFMKTLVYMNHNAKVTQRYL